MQKYGLNDSVCKRHKKREKRKEISSKEDCKGERSAEKIEGREGAFRDDDSSGGGGDVLSGAQREMERKWMERMQAEEQL